MSLINKAKEVSGQAVEKVNELAGDDLIANTIIRMVEKQERINEILSENGLNYRISGIEVENSLPPKAVFTVTREDLDLIETRVPQDGGQ